MHTRRDVFQAMADPTRRAILILLATSAMTAGNISAEFKSSRQTISKHLHILTACGLLKQTQKGREIHYLTSAAKLKEVADFLEPFKAHWECIFSKMDAILNDLNN